MIDNLTEVPIKGGALKDIVQTPTSRSGGNDAVPPSENLRTKKKESHVSQRLKIIAGVVALLGLIAAGWQRWHHAALYVSTDNAQIEGTLIPVRNKLSGIVTTVAVADNDRVANGALLVQLRAAEFQQHVADARAQLLGLQIAAGKNGTGEIDSQIRVAAAKNQSAQAIVAQLQAQLENARTEYQRIEDLALKGVASAQQRDNVRTQMLSLQQQLSAAQSELRAAGAVTDLHHAELKVQDYKIEAAQAMLALAEIQLEDTTLRAPCAGIVAHKNVEPGQFAITGQQLMTLTCNSELWVIANVKETDVGRIHIGQDAHITIDAYPDNVLSGTVQSIEPATGAKFSLLPQENATGNFTKVVQRVPVKILLRDVPADDALQLRPGMSVYVEIGVRDKNDS